MASFVVFGQAAGPIQRCEGALDDPTLGQEFELVQFIALDHFDLVAEHLLSPFDQRTCVTSVNEHLPCCAGCNDRPAENAGRTKDAPRLHLWRDEHGQHFHLGGDNRLLPLRFHGGIRSGHSIQLD